VQFGLDEKEILTPEEQKKQFEEKQKEKAKYQWKKDAEADRAERERLRRQLEEDRQARAAKVHAVILPLLPYLHWPPC
jgi:hypothetical protein